MSFYIIFVKSTVVQKLIFFYRSMLTNSATGELYKKGEIIKLPKLARTFELIAEDPFAFYNGSLARDIVNDIGNEGQYLNIVLLNLSVRPNLLAILISIRAIFFAFHSTCLYIIENV